MYPRVKRVHRGDQVYEYVQLVTGERVDGKVRQRVVATLGRLDELKASGQLDRWAGGFTRLEPPPGGRGVAAGRALPAPARPGRADRRGRPDARQVAADPRRGDQCAGREPAQRPRPAL